MSALLDIDLQLLRFINLDLAHPVLTRLMLFVTDKHNWYPFILAAVVFLLIAGRKLPRQGNFFTRVNPRVYIFGLILTVAFADQLAGFLKDGVNRTRPCRDAELSQVLNCPLHAGGRRSFPSNHAANSAGLAVFSSLVYPPAAVPALAFAFVVGFSRTYLAVHYPTDVLAGWLLGALTGYGVWLLLRKRLHRPGITGYANMFRFRQHQQLVSPGGNWKEHRWRALDGHGVSGWLLTGSEKLVIFIHGMGGSACTRTVLGEKLREKGGYSFLLVPLRGSDGHPVKLTSGGVDEPHDILGALRFAVSCGYKMENTVLYCTSMGGSASLKACALAGELLPRGLVVHGAYRSFFSSAEHRTGRAGVLYLRLVMPRKARGNLERFQPVYWLRHLNRGCRVKYIYGERDRMSPPGEGRHLADQTPGITCGFELLHHRGHPTGGNTSDDSFSELLNRIVAESLRNETG